MTFLLGIEYRRFTTVGYGSRPDPQMSAEVILLNNETAETVTLWKENSARGFSPFGHKHVLPAARKFQADVAKVLGCSIAPELEIP